MTTPKPPHEPPKNRLPDEVPLSILSPPGLVSIIIPCAGMLEYTQLCVPSVLLHTRPPFELIFIDIASLDGTSAYLAGVTAGLSTRVEVVHCATDLGIKQVVKMALDRARGEYLVLLNNDTVVTEFWLDQMIGLATSQESIGLVGPMSNYAAVPQLVETVPYRIGPRKGARWHSGADEHEVLVDVSAVVAFTRKFREQNTKKWLMVERLGGFCLLVKRAVLKKIEAHSTLREWTDLGLFDTDILSVKARQVGYSMAVCRDLFIHHFGSRTFAHGAPENPERPPT